MHKKVFHMNCPHFSACSGCTLNRDLWSPPVLADMLNYFDVKQVAFDIKNSPVMHWRIRAKLSVRGNTSHPLIGLYKKNSHEVIAIPSCQIHHPLINKAVEVIRKFVQNEKIEPYNEQTHQGLIRYLQLTVDLKALKVQVVFVLNRMSIDFAHRPSFKKLWERHPDLWHSFWFNYNVEKTNVIMGVDWELFQGEENLWIKLRDKEICFHPGSFIQANLFSFENLLKDLEKMIPEGVRFLEYFAGVGVVGFSLLKRCREIVCCEINPQGLKSFEKTCEKLSDGDREKICYQVGDAKHLLDLLSKAEYLFVDPPRKGLDLKFIQAVDRSTCQNFIYMSCGWRSFQRDCDMLLRLGWRLKQVNGYLFFPGTDHIELLAHFHRF